MKNFTISYDLVQITVEILFFDRITLKKSITPIIMSDFALVTVLPYVNTVLHLKLFITTFLQIALEFLQ